jgi:predicted nucleic acid-binding protein
MVLVDTSIWIDHFRNSDLKLEYLLNDGKAFTHTLVIGEIACGNFKNRKLILSLMNALPSISEISREEYFIFLEQHKMYGLGLGFIDINLLASAVLANCELYTRDKALRSAAEKFNIDYK